MKIGIDLDGVLANFNDGFKRIIIQVTQKDLFGPNHIYTHWDWDIKAGYTLEERQASMDVVDNSTTFWQDLQPHKHNIEALNKALWEGNLGQHEIYFISSRFHGKLIKDQTETWLEKQGIERPTVLLSDRKGLMAYGLRLDCFIDDHVPNVLDVLHHSPSTRAYLLRTSENKLNEWQPSPNRGVDSIEEFLVVEGLL